MLPNAQRRGNTWNNGFHLRISALIFLDRSASAATSATHCESSAYQAVDPPTKVHKLSAHLRTELRSRHPWPQAIRLQLGLHITVKSNQILSLSDPYTLLARLVRREGGRLGFGILVCSIEGRMCPLEDFGAHCIEELKVTELRKKSRKWRGRGRTSLTRRS